MTKEVGFLYTPFALARVDGETSGLKTFEDLVEELEVFVEGLAEARNVVDVNFDVLDGAKDSFHDLLGDVGRLGDAHGETAVAVETEGCGDGAEFLGRVVEFEGVELHADIEFGEESVTCSAGEDILNTGYGVYFAAEGLVQSAEVGDPADAFVFLRDDE